MRQPAKCLSQFKQLRQIVSLRACITHRHLRKPWFGKPVGHKVNRQQLPWITDISIRAQGSILLISQQLFPFPLSTYRHVFTGAALGRALQHCEGWKSKINSLSSGQSGHRQHCESCHPSHQQVSQAVFLNSEANRQQRRMYLTGSMQDVSTNKRKSRMDFTAQRKLIVKNSTTIATYTIFSPSHPQDQQKPLMQPLVSVFFVASRVLS